MISQLELENIRRTMAVSLSGCELETSYDCLKDIVTLQVTKSFPGLKSSITVRQPRTWWDHLKQNLKDRWEFFHWLEFNESVRAIPVYALFEDIIPPDLHYRTRISYTT